MKPIPQGEITLRQSIKEQEIKRIVDAITGAISAQHIAPGTRLIEGQLIEQFDANRNHIRTALQRLASKHLVTIRPNMGASIAEPSLEEAEDIFAARQIVERGIIETLICNQTPVDIAILKKQLLIEKRAIESKNRAQIIQESGNFHLTLARLSKNKILEEMLIDLIARSTLIVSLYQEKDDAQCACREHDQIAFHIENKNTMEALECMAKHLQNIKLNQNMDLWERRTVNPIKTFVEHALSPLNP